MFKCPKCGNNTETYARKRTNGEYVYGRYRRCPFCGHKFATIERLVNVDDEIYMNGWKDSLTEVRRVITDALSGIKER